LRTPADATARRTSLSLTANGGRRARRSRLTSGGRRRFGAWRREIEAVRQLVRELLGLIAEIRLEVGRRNLDPEHALTHLALAEVAEQRQQRADLTARVRETGPVDVLAPLPGAELPDLFQVHAPVP